MKAIQITNKIKGVVLLFSLLFVALCVKAGNKENKVKRVDIYYYHEGGYGMYYSHAIYKRNKNVFEFNLKDWRKTNNVKNVPIAIDAYFVDRFVSEAQKMRKDTCEAYRISKEDIDDYRRLLLEDTIYLSLKDVDINKYQSVSDQTLLEMSCSEICKALSCPGEKYFGYGALAPNNERVVFTYSDGSTMELRPYTSYRGAPWKVIQDGETYYLDYNFFSNYIKRIGWEEHFMMQFERGEMVYDVVTYLFSQESK